ncbi:hypothetical protein ACF09C_07810 [Streptomyces sp. NPDC014870]|uniref:hypothetical protein n=1 Tax=Streptomyces sp. NPDC014870 TaxID=3364925 RepID=UPI0036F623B8
MSDACAVALRFAEAPSVAVVVDACAGFVVAEATAHRFPFAMVAAPEGPLMVLRPRMSL